MFKKITCSRRLHVQEDYKFRTIKSSGRLQVQEDNMFKKITCSKRLQVQEDYMFTCKAPEMFFDFCHHSSSLLRSSNPTEFQRYLFSFRRYTFFKFLFITRFYGNFTADGPENSRFRTFQIFQFLLLL